MIDQNEVVQMYQNGICPCVIAEKLGCSKTYISFVLKKNNIRIVRDYSKTRYSRKNRHLINEDFFVNIDSEEKAYFLGLMCADGSVTKNGFYLKMIDEDIIQKFKEALKTTAPIIYRAPVKENWNGTYTLQICSQKMANSLALHGCIPNKTKTLQLPVIDNELIRHFLRGFFDGDGCLVLDDKIYHCSFNITSASLEFLNQIRPFINEHSKTNGTIYKESKHDVYHLRYGGHQCVDILNWLYKDAHVFLNRKHFKYQLLLKLSRP